MSRLKPGIIAGAYGIQPPKRYLRFFERREFLGLGRLILKRGFLEGEFLTDFTSTRLLPDIQALLDRQQFPAMAIDRWQFEFPGLVPFALLDEPVREGTGSEPTGAFLVVRLNRPGCPVYVMVRDGPAALPLAPSLDAFVRGQAWRNAEPSTTFVSGVPYYAFGWRRPLRPHPVPGTAGRAPAR